MLNFNTSLKILWFSIRKLAITILSIFILTKCATHPSQIDGSYVSSMTFAEYECQELNLLMAGMKERSDYLYKSQSAKSRADKWKMGVGLVLFWPALFALEGGDGLHASEYAKLKGEYEALQALSLQKGCNPYAEFAVRPQSVALTTSPVNAIAGLPDKESILKNLREANVITEEDYEAALSPEDALALPSRLRELKSLRSEGILTEKAYQSARSKTIIKFIDEQLE